MSGDFSEGYKLLVVAQILDHIAPLLWAATAVLTLEALRKFQQIRLAYWQARHAKSSAVQNETLNGRE